jgi:hypothetical protein
MVNETITFGEDVMHIDRLQLLAGWCQSNANQSPNSRMMRASCRQLAPLGQRGGMRGVEQVNFRHKNSLPISTIARETDEAHGGLGHYFL